MQDWLLNLIQNFFVGGVITVAISYVGTFLDPVLAAILWSFPVSILPSMYYMYISGKGNKFLAKFSTTTTFALVVLFFTTMAMGHFYRTTPEGFWIPILKTVGIWIGLSVVYYFIIKYFHLEKKFA